MAILHIFAEIITINNNNNYIKKKILDLGDGLVGFLIHFILVQERPLPKASWRGNALLTV